MKTLRVGIASLNEMKARTLAIAKGDLKTKPTDPKIWFPSVESFARVLSNGNHDLLRTIADKRPGSLAELSQLTGRHKSNLSRTLKTLENYGLVKLTRGSRGRVAADVPYREIILVFDVAGNSTSVSRHAA